MIDGAVQITQRAREEHVKMSESVSGYLPSTIFRLRKGKPLPIVG